MDVICLVRQDETAQQPRMEAVGMGGYLLLRIDLNVDMERWFHVSLERPKWAPEEEHPSILQDRKKKKWFHRRMKRKEKNHRQMETKRKRSDVPQTLAQDREEQLQEYDRNVALVRDGIRRVAKDIQDLPEPDSTFYMVYDKSLAWLGRPEAARAGIVLAGLWQKYLPFPEFQRYVSSEWLERLAPEAPFPNVMILGKGNGIYSVLEKHARKIREVRWILFREDCDEVFRKFVEDFYQEHGLVIRYKVIDDVGYLKETGVSCPERTTVYDFTGGLYVTVKKMAPGSTWLDIRFSYTKWEQIKAFSEGKKNSCEYRSFYKIWTEIQKKYNCPYFLDSIEENRYNTLETVGARGYKSNELR